MSKKNLFNKKFNKSVLSINKRIESFFNFFKENFSHKKNFSRNLNAIDKRIFFTIAIIVIALTGFFLSPSFFNKNKIKAEKINKVLQGSPHIVEMISEKKISLVFNTTETPQAIKDSKSIRRSALESETPYYTTVSGANAAVMAIKAIRNSEMTVKTIQSFGESLN